MADAVVGAVGFAFSAVALVGLFSTCMECYRYVDNGKGQGTDSELLLCRVRIEDVRFQLWGQGTSSRRRRTE
jgi:Prion-inhibition and propagation